MKKEKSTESLFLLYLESISYKNGGRFFANGSLTFSIEGKKIQIKNITNAKTNCLALQEMLSFSPVS